MAARGQSARLADTVREFVDYLLFVDEAPLPSTVRGSSSLIYSRAFDALPSTARNLVFERMWATIGNIRGVRG